MKIVHIIPGSGGTFYCQNCLRDNTLVKGLRDAGHDVILVPLYLPMFSDTPELTRDVPIFFGAVTIYLKYKFPLLRGLFNGLKWILNAMPLLRKVAKISESVKPKGLEGMTIAMLKGQDGPMADEVNNLLNWLEHEGKPDVIHIANPLLLGLAEGLKKRLNVPIACSLQDEKLWLDGMEDVYEEEIWRLMAERGRFVDVFTSVSQAYADELRGKLQLTDEKIRTVPIGMDIEGYQPAKLPKAPPVVGYLSKISEGLGFGVLTDAVLELKKQENLRDLQLHATGGVIGEDTKYVRNIEQRFSEAGFPNDIVIQREFDREKRMEFLQSLSVMSVPVPVGEAFGTYMIEAMACGIPVIQPEIGGFPEIIHHTGGGILYAPDAPNGLVNALKSVLLDPEKQKLLGESGRKAIMEDYTIQRMVERTLKVYTDLLQNQGDRAAP